MTATAYCSKGTTGSGAPAQRGGVAADPRLIPIGSTIGVRGLKGAPDGTYTVLDTGRSVKGRHIDFFLPRCEDAKAFGRQAIRVRVVHRARK